jgi:cyclophilin family peptidyl-prolyl cis-trans isomerase
MKFRILLPFFLTLLLFGCTKKDKNPIQIELNPSKSITSKDLKVSSSGLSQESIILKTAKGNIVIKLYPNDAPNTVTRFLQLVQEGFYDGLDFHRVHPKFLIQTGDPSGTGNGGSGTKLKAEFNKLQHIKGTVAMARRPEDNDSADSQFYISLATLTHLDSSYTVFGQVVNGFDVLDRIKQNDKILTISLRL